MKNGQFPAVLNLTDLNGQNGFKLEGENTGDEIGYTGSYSVSAAGDINGDSYADLIIGAIGYPGGSDKGRSYVVFGGPTGTLSLNSDGTFDLGSLNGLNYRVQRMLFW
jgi:FG-GAP repeat